MDFGNEDDDSLKKLNKKKLPVIGIRKSQRMLVHGKSLASVESLSLPLVQEIVISADIRCCECQKRIAQIMSRMTETDSVEVNVLDKKVALTYRYSASMAKVHARQVPAIRSNPLNKMAILRYIFRSRQS